MKREIFHSSSFNTPFATFRKPDTAIHNALVHDLQTAFDTFQNGHLLDDLEVGFTRRELRKRSLTQRGACDRVLAFVAPSCFYSRIDHKATVTLMELMVLARASRDQLNPTHR